jgi:hypothetical protein
MNTSKKKEKTQMWIKLNIFINKHMAIKMNTSYAQLESIIKSSIYENKMDLINRSKEYGPLQIAYIKGYICCLEEILKEINDVNVSEYENTYKICLN